MVWNHEVIIQVNVRTENRHGRSDPLYLLVQTTSEPIKLLAETKVGQLNIYNIFNYLHNYLHTSVSR